jgi:hypothetical protein
MGTKRATIFGKVNVRYEGHFGSKPKDGKKISKALAYHSFDTKPIKLL